MKPINTIVIKSGKAKGLPSGFPETNPEEWEESWERVNRELYESGGVNHHAYRLGFLAGRKTIPVTPESQFCSCRPEVKAGSTQDFHCNVCGKLELKLS